MSGECCAVKCEEITERKFGEGNKCDTCRKFIPMENFKKINPYFKERKEHTGACHLYEDEYEIISDCRSHAGCRRYLNKSDLSILDIPIEAMDMEDLTKALEVYDYENKAGMMQHCTHFIKLKELARKNAKEKINAKEPEKAWEGKITPNIMRNIANNLFNNVFDIESKKKCLEGYIKDLGRQDWSRYSGNDLKAIGFSVWDEESNLLLATPLLLKMTKIGFELDSINGDKKVFDEKFDDFDYRFGATAYGIIIK